MGWVMAGWPMAASQWAFQQASRSRGPDRGGQADGGTCRVFIASQQIQWSRLRWAGRWRNLPGGSSQPADPVVQAAAEQQGQRIRQDRRQPNRPG